MALSTPTKSRAAGMLPSAAPITPRSAIRTKPRAEASPQVKAAIATMRAAKVIERLERTLVEATPISPATSSSTESSSLLEDHDDDADSSSAHDRNGRARSGMSSRTTVRTETAADEMDARAGWAVKSIKTLIRDARETGRLSLSSRSLKKVPVLVYSTLIPLSSAYHSSNYLSPSPSPSASPSHIQRTTAVAEAEDCIEDIAWNQVDLTVLHLASNELELIEDRIAGLEDLQALDIHSNALTSLPHSFGELHHLTSLNLSCNQITHFPTCLLRLRSLQSLDLSHNALERLFPSSGPPPLSKLRTLNLSHNPLRSALLSSASSQLVWPTQLVQLDLSSVRIKDGDLSFKALRRLDQLEVLCLSDNELAFEGDTLDAETTGAGSFRTLKKVNLSRNRIRALQGVGRIFSVVGTSLEYHGIVNSVMYGSAPMEMTMEAQEQKGKLEIDVEGNHFEDEAKRLRAVMRARRLQQEDVDDMISPPTPSIEESNALLEKEAVEHEVVEELSNRLQILDLHLDLPLLTFYNLHRTSFALSLPSLDLTLLPLSTSDLPLSVIPTRIEGSTSNTSHSLLHPTTIDLSHNNISLFPLVALVHLQWNTTLTKLDLSNNKITNLRSLLSVDAIPLGGLAALRFLRLRNNLLCDSDEERAGDGEGIFETLAMIAPALEELDLRYNLLTHLAGLSHLLLPQASLAEIAQSTSKKSGGGGRGGVRSLLLAGNRIANVAGLVDVALLLRGKDSSMRSTDREAGGCLSRTGWRCERIDLSRNEIARLPINLGHLPLMLSLAVEGNTFRVPSREIAEGGSAGLMEWLRSRVAAE